MNETPAKTALLIIDVQSELFHKSTPIYRAKELLENIQALTEYAHQSGAPVVYIQHSSNAFLIKGSEGWQIHPQLKPLAGEKIIHKRHPSAFKEPSLKEFLDSKGIRRLVIAGLVTHGCVKATSLDALKHDYQVVLVSDAHSSFSKDAAKLITEWNGKIGKAGAMVEETEAVAF